MHCTAINCPPLLRSIAPLFGRLSWSSLQCYIIELFLHANLTNPDFVIVQSSSSTLSHSLSSTHPITHAHTHKHTHHDPSLLLSFLRFFPFSSLYFPFLYFFSFPLLPAEDAGEVRGVRHESRRPRATRRSQVRTFVKCLKSSTGTLHLVLTLIRIIYESITFVRYPCVLLLVFTLTITPHTHADMKSYYPILYFLFILPLGIFSPPCSKTSAASMCCSL